MKCEKHQGSVDMITVAFSVENCPFCKLEQAEAEVEKLRAGNIILCDDVEQAEAEVEDITEEKELWRVLAGKRAIDNAKLRREMDFALSRLEVDEKSEAKSCLEQALKEET